MNRLVYFLAASLLVSVGTNSASATTYWISTTGSDSADGLSPATAWATWSHADSIAVSGDTVRILAGTYTLCTAGDCLVTRAPGVTWISDTPLGAKLVGQTTGNNGSWRIQGHDSTVQGFDCTATSSQAHCIYTWTGANNVRIVRNYVHDMKMAGDCSQYGDGIIIGDSSVTGVVIDSNKVVNIGPAGSNCGNIFGITGEGQNNTISNNIIANSNGGFEWHENSNGSAGSIFVNNTVINNRHAGALIDTTAPYTPITIENNIFVNNNGTCGVDIYAGGSATLITNLFNGNSPGAYCLDGTEEPAPDPSGQTYADPQFVNYQGDGSGDYHLQPTSLAKNAGTADNAPAADFESVVRPQGPGFDIGAYESMLMQSANVEGSAVTSVSQSFPNANVAGDLIIAFVRMSTTAQTVQVTDSLGNVYADAVSQGQSVDGHQIHIFYAKNIAAGVNTITATFSAVNNHPWLAIYEYSGLSTSAPLDQTSSAQGFTSAANTGATASTSSAHELLFAAVGLPAPSSWIVTSGSGFTSLQQDTNVSRAATEGRIVNAAGQYAATFSLSGATYWTAAIATFK